MDFKKCKIVAWGLGHIVLALLISSCKYSSAPEDQDLLELERARQYMSAYSIYQERLPTESAALSFSDPASLVFSINDTLRSWTNTAASPDYYGRYYYNLKDLERELGISYRNKRARSPGPTVFFQRLTDSTAYIQILEFQQTTADEMKAYVDDAAPFPNLIINMRYNPGGYIDICQELIELFLYKGRTYLHAEYRREDAGGNTFSTVEEDWSTVNNDIDLEGKKIAVFINDSSASAAEMMALALRDGMDPGRTRIYGQRSYGKAIGQYVFFFYSSSGAGLKLTGFRFTGTSGDDLKDIYHEVGITPDVLYPKTVSVDSMAADAIAWLESDSYERGEKASYTMIRDFSRALQVPFYPRCVRIVPVFRSGL